MLTLETAQLLADAIDSLAGAGVFIGVAIFVNAFLRE